VTDVRRRVRVIDRRGDEKCLRHLRIICSGSLWLSQTSAVRYRRYSTELVISAKGAEVTWSAWGNAPGLI
jgi:hypothetical protein